MAGNTEDERLVRPRVPDNSVPDRKNHAATTRRWKFTPKGKFFAISKLDKFADWQVEAEHNAVLEWYNFECPRRKGDFTFETVKEFQEVKLPLKITPKLPLAGSAFLPMYSVLAHATGVEIPGEPTEIGLMVSM